MRLNNFLQPFNLLISVDLLLYIKRMCLDTVTTACFTLSYNISFLHVVLTTTTLLNLEPWTSCMVRMPEPFPYANLWQEMDSFSLNVNVKIYVLGRVFDIGVPVVYLLHFRNRTSDLDKCMPLQISLRAYATTSGFQCGHCSS